MSAGPVDPRRMAGVPRASSYPPSSLGCSGGSGRRVAEGGHRNTMVSSCSGGVAVALRISPRRPSPDRQCEDDPRSSQPTRPRKAIR